MVAFTRGSRPRRRALGLGAGLVALLALVPALGQRPAAEDLIDLTLLFHSAVQGKIEPCG
jgi:hypothetical protein